MECVKERLYKTDVGKDTQFMETQIIETLREMIEALKKRNRTSRKIRLRQDHPAKARRPISRSCSTKSRNSR